MIVAFHSYSGITCESGSLKLWNSTLRNDNFYPRSTNKTFSYLRKTFVVLHFLWSINGQYLTHFYRDFSYSSVIHFTKNLSTVESFG